MYKLVVVILLSALFSVAFSQQQKFPSYFGIQFKPVIPGDFLAKSEITTRNGNFTGVFQQKYGYSFGGITRIGFTKLISFETGINLVRRNYNINFSLPDSSLSGKGDVGIVSYDIPINAMIYVQLSKEFFMNASIGSSFVYYPSNVATIVPVDSKVVFQAEGRRNRRFDAEVNANTGFEWRTEKNGFFYIGASAKLPFAPIFKVAAIYKFPSEESVVAISEVNGAYISLDFRYFFHNTKRKGLPQQTGPIIQ
jgi:hypothetical protein